MDFCLGITIEEMGENGKFKYHIHHNVTNRNYEIPNPDYD